MMNQVLSRLDACIDGVADTYSATARGLSLFRILFAFPIVFFSSGPRALWVTQYPDLFFFPPRPLSLLDCTGTVQLGIICGFPSYWLILFLELGAALTAVFLLFGYWTVPTSILFTIFLITLNTFRYSFGKIDHDILFVVTPTILSFSGWGNYFSIDAMRGRKTEWSYPSYSLFFLALAIGAGFLSAGFPKAVNWIDFNLSTSGVRSWVVNNYFVNGRTDLLAPIFAFTTNVYFWEAMDYVAVAFEVGLALSVMYRPALNRFLVIAVFFHLMNYLMLNIPFALHLPIYAAFLPWKKVVKSFKSKWINNVRKIAEIRYMFAVCVLYTVSYLVDPFSYISWYDEFKIFTYFGISILVVSALIFREAKQRVWFRHSSSAP